MIIVFRLITLEYYVNESGISPFIEWLESLGDARTRHRIKERLDRVALGNFGDRSPIAEGVAELKCHFGSGYRIYYGEVDTKIILLLCGGNKSSQKRDIKKALKYWQDFLRR